MEHKPTFSEKIDARINEYGDIIEDFVGSLRKKRTPEEVLRTLTHAGLIAYLCVFVVQRLEERERQRAWYTDGQLPYCQTPGLAQGTHCKMDWSKTGPGKLARWVEDEAGNLYTVLFKNKDGGDVALKTERVNLEAIFKTLRAQHPESWMQDTHVIKK